MEPTTTTDNEQNDDDRKKMKSFGANFRKRFNKAMFIMSKIKYNERKGTPHPNDQRNRERCERVIIDYRRYRKTIVGSKMKEEKCVKREQQNKQRIRNNTKSDYMASNSGNNELISPPSPPFWRQLSTSTSAADQYKYYLSRLERMKMYADKGKLNRNERRDEKNCRRAIRKYEERNGGKPKQANEDGEGPQNDQGFQLSVNYFESEGKDVIKEEMEEFSHSSWGDQTSSSNFPGDQQDTLNWGANSSWNYKQMEPENYQEMASNSSFNRTKFAGVNSTTTGNKYDSELRECGRPESSWNYGGWKTETLFERRGNGESFKRENNFDFKLEQMSNHSWNYGDSKTDIKQEMRKNTPNQHFNFKDRNNFQSGFNEMKRHEENFRSNHYSNGMWNDYNPRFERRHEMQGNSSTNSPSLEPSSSARNNFKSEQTWTTNQLPATNWNHDEPRAGNFISPNPFKRSRLNLEMRNSTQQVDTFASTSNGNKMTNSFWNQSDSTESFQSIKEHKSLPSTTTTEEDSAKILLEKKIFDLLNALAGDNAGKKQFSQDELPNKPPNAEENKFSQEMLPNKLTISPTELNKARENLTKCSRKRKSDLSETEVITLTDDSDQEEETKEEEKKAEKEYFKALVYLRKLDGRDRTKTLTEQEAFFKETSEFIVKQYEKKFGSKQQNTQLPQEQTNESENKITPWSCSTNNTTALTDSTAPKPAKTKIELQIAIIDRCQTDLRISQRLWPQMERNLNKALQQEVEKTNNTNISQFDAKNWRRGIKIVICKNIDALNFIQCFISKYSLQNPRQQYDVIPLSQLPKRSTFKVWIPPANTDDKDILKTLKVQNRSLHTASWTLISCRDRPNNNGKDLLISMSMASVEKLRFVKGEIVYGNARLKMEPSEFKGKQ